MIASCIYNPFFCYKRTVHEVRFFDEKREKIMKKIISLLTCGFVILGLFMNISITHAEDSITREGNTIYANGTTVIIQKDGSQAYIYDEQGQKLSEQAVTTSTTLYGGSKNQDLNHDVKISVHGVKLSKIYGGGYSDGTHSANVNGNVNITIDGNVDASNIYGGGYAEGSHGDAVANVNGHITISIPATPQNYHSVLTGGGQSISKEYSATANVTSTQLTTTGRIYSVRGGGIAQQSKSAKATANVSGKAAIQLNDADIREVYCGGSANKNSEANCQKTELQINQSEVMSIYGGGTANAGQANVNTVNLLLKGTRFYGYIFGGGDASSGGQANVQKSTIQLDNCDIYVDEQFGQMVAGTIYAGGEASGAQSSATVNDVTLTMDNNTTAGNVYCGGEESTGGNSEVQNITLNSLNQKGAQYKGETYYSSLFGSADHLNHVTKSVKMTIQDSHHENIWGSIDDKDYPTPLTKQVSVQFIGQNNLSTLAAFDKVAVDEPLYLKMVLGKDKDKATQLIQDDHIAVGTPLIYCDDTEGVQDVFTLKNGKLDYRIIDGKSVWKVGQMTYTIQTEMSGQGSITPSLQVNKNSNAIISWQADQGSSVESVTIDGQKISSDTTSYQFNDVLENHHIKVVFKKKPGQVNNQVDIQGDKKAPHVTVKPDNDKVQTLLTKEDKLDIANGIDVSFQASINVAKQLPQSIQKAVQKVLTDKVVALSLDIDFLKVKGEQIQKLTNLPTAIRFVIDIPTEYLSSNRSFSVVRTHVLNNGQIETTLLKDLDNNPNTITFETDRFSYYTLVYQERGQKPQINVPETKKPITNASDTHKDASKGVQSGDQTDVTVYFVLLTLMTCGLLYEFKKHL